MTIVSHTHEFIFFKPRKVAGSSLLVAFGQHCRDPDIVTAPGNTEGFVRNAMNCTGIPPHTYPYKIKAILEPQIWDRYFKVTCIRNPWDAVVSMLFWKIFREHKKGIKFTDSVRAAILNGTIDPRNPEYRTQINIIIDSLARNNAFYLDENRAPWANYYMRYEHLKRDFDTACDQIGLPKTELPHLKGKARVAGLNYRSFFDDALKDAVYAKHAPTIDFFGYDF